MVCVKEQGKKNIDSEFTEEHHLELFRKIQNASDDQKLVIDYILTNVSEKKTIRIKQFLRI